MAALGFSSERYHIKIADLLQLVTPLDAFESFSSQDSFSDDVILLIGQQSKDFDDYLLKGRQVLLEAQKQGISHFRTRIVFEQRAPKLSFLALIKPIRKKYQDFSYQNYEIALSDIIDNHLERNLKTEETAYNYSDRNKWSVPKEQRQTRFQQIDESFKNDGYNKKYPMVIMLCRGLGVKDKLHQGHHRMYFCRKYDIPFVQVQFLAANSFTGYLKAIFLWLNKILKYKQVN